MYKSILTTIKNMLGPSAEDDYFDSEIIDHINSVFAILTQMGVGPTDGFTIEDEFSTWRDFLGDAQKYFISVKTYVYQKVKLIFDPPTNSSHLAALKESIAELEWRLNFAAESTSKEENSK